MIKFTVTSTKGGVGKTTLTANLGALLADMGLRVLLIDADVQPSLSKYFPLAVRETGGRTDRGDRARPGHAVVHHGDVCIRTSTSWSPTTPRAIFRNWLLNRIDRGFRLRFALQSPAVAEPTTAC